MNPYIVKYQVLRPFEVPDSGAATKSGLLIGKQIKMYQRRPTGEEIIRVSFAYSAVDAAEEVKARVLGEWRAAKRHEDSLLLAGVGAPVTADDFARVAAELRSRQGAT